MSKEKHNHEKPEEFIDESTSGLINYLARGLVGMFGITESDVDDLRQELSLQLLQRSQKFDSSKSLKKTYVDRVLRNRIRSIVERQKRKGKMYKDYLRNKEGHPSSVHRVHEEDERPDSLERLIELDRIQRKRSDLKFDLEYMSKRLSPDMQELLERLKMNPRIGEVARELGVNRNTIRQHLGIIKCIFEEAGLDEYL